MTSHDVGPQTFRKTQAFIPVVGTPLIAINEAEVKRTFQNLFLNFKGRLGCAGVVALEGNIDGSRTDIGIVCIFNIVVCTILQNEITVLNLNSRRKGRTCIQLVRNCRYLHILTVGHILGNDGELNHLRAMVVLLRRDNRNSSLANSHIIHELQTIFIIANSHFITT